MKHELDPGLGRHQVKRQPFRLITMTTQSTFDQYCIVELFGHQKIAGRVTEQQIGGSTFIRVDVPATTKQEAFSKMYGASAIYAITPTDEATAALAAEAYQSEPIELWRLKVVADSAARRLGPAVIEDDFDTDDENEDY